MNDIRRKLAAGLVLGFLVILGLGVVGDIRKVADHFLSFAWIYAPAVLALTLINYSLRFIKWHFFLAQIGIRDLPIRLSARLFVAGFPLAVTPGKVGEALKGVWLNQKTGVPVAKGVTVVLAERISDGLAVLSLSTLGVIAYPRYWPVFAIVLGSLITAVVISQVRPVALKLLSWIEKIPVLGRFAAQLQEFYEGTYALFKPRVIVLAVGLGFIAWLAEGIGLYLVLLGLGVDPGSEALSLSVFVLAFSTVVGAISALPGGLIAAEGSIATMLALLLGLSRSTSAAATLLIRFGTLWLGVTLGLIVWLFSRDLLLPTADEPDTSSVES
jgi:uncharacterized protein (TIRG00374 family)